MSPINKPLRNHGPVGRTSGTPKQDGAITKRGLDGSTSHRAGNPQAAVQHGGTPVPSPTSVDSLAGGSVVSQCGSCDVAVGQDGIRCDKCDSWFHPKPLCMGVSDRVIDAIREAGGAGVEYVCTHCRSRPVDTGAGSGMNSPGDPAIAQLFVMVKSLCTAITKLTDRVDSLAGHSGGVQQPVDPALLQKWVREDTRELLERDKRRDSIIIRGIPSDNIQASFTEIVQFLCLNLNIVLSDVVPLRPNLVRAKILVLLHWSELLSRSRNMAVSQFQSVYISRDLTYRQRQELREKRAAAAGGPRLTGGGGGIGSGSGSAGSSGSAGNNGVAVLNVPGSGGGSVGGVEQTPLPSVATPPLVGAPGAGLKM